MEPADADNKNAFSKRIEAQEKRKLMAQNNKDNAWSGLGMFGMVGWSVVVPSVVGVVAGLWLDKHHPVPFSWTLSLLFAGLIAGCLIAWYWVVKEEKDIHQ